jgi:hypothetical protein
VTGRTPPPPPQPEGPATFRYGPWIIGLLALLVVLMIVLIVLLAGDDGGSDAATTSRPTTEATTTTDPPPTTAAPTTSATTTPATTTTAATSTTAATTTTVVTTTAPVTAGSFVVTAQGLDGPVSLLAGLSPEDANASGFIDYPGPVFTEEQDGYECGFGSGTGALAETFDVMFLVDGASRFYILSPALRTLDGLGIGSSTSDVEAVFGPPTETGPEEFGTGTNLFYRSGDHGFVFTTNGGVVEFMSVGFYDALFFVEGCL